MGNFKTALAGACAAALLAVPLTSKAHGGHGYWNHGHRHDWRNQVRHYDDCYRPSPNFQSWRSGYDRRVIIQERRRIEREPVVQRYPRPAVVISVPPLVIPF